PPPDPTETAPPTGTPEPTVGVTPTASPTPTSTAEAEETPTLTPTLTLTPTPTATPEPDGMYVVDSTGDAGDADLSDGRCNDGTDVCTLRAAIDQANAYPGLDTI